MTTLHQAVIATDSPEVEDVCRAFGAPVELTSSHHRCGTDRVAEVANLPEYSRFEVIVNVQGDEPLIDEAHVRAAVGLVTSGAWEIGTCATPLGSAHELAASSVVKVGRATDGAALWFSRSARAQRAAAGAVPAVVPAEEEATNVTPSPPLRHIGLYAYARAALTLWSSLESDSSEVEHSLEQLRALGAGMRVGVEIVNAVACGVDTPSDVRRVERIIRREHFPAATRPPYPASHTTQARVLTPSSSSG